MRIGMFSWESLYSIKVGGVAPHVSELAEALARKGHDLHVFTRRGDFDAFDKINEVYYQRVDLEPSGDLLEQMNRMGDAMCDRFAQVQKIFGPFDIVHGHDWHPVLALNRIKREHGLPYVLTMHSTEWGRNGNTFSDWEIAKEISHREWLGGYESSRVIVTTRRMLEEMKMIYNIPEEKISIIPNGILPGKIGRMVDPGRVKERYGIHPLAPVILFCGRMSYQKGPDLLIEAIPDILRSRWDAKFVFIGEGDMRWACERRAEDLGVKGACRFLGYIRGAEKEDLMNACDITCVPSRNEPFGVVVLEAWDAGKPVVATEAVSIIHNFEDGVLAYIQPQSIAWGVNYLLQHPKEMKEMAYAGRRRMQAECSWNPIANKTEEVYSKVLGRQA